MTNKGELSEKEKLFLKAVLKDKKRYNVAGVKFRLSYDEMSKILAKKGIEKKFNGGLRVSQSTLNAIKDVVDNGLSMNAAAKRYNLKDGNSVRHYMILNGIHSNKQTKQIKKASPAKSRTKKAQVAPEPIPEEAREIESTVKVQEKRS